MTESAIPPEWVGKNVIVVLAGAQQDRDRTGRLEAVGSDGCLLHTGSAEQDNIKRFFPWQAIRQVRLGRD